MDAVRYGPTDGLSYNPNDENYWDADALQKEITRAFELCHGCRLCFKYCSSFPALFAAVDANDGDVRQTAQETVDRVVDHCFQCQLCYVNCPYTPGEEHEFQLDFPRLLMRIKAQRVKKTGLAWREKMFRDPVKIGERAKPTASIANWANTLRPLRVIAEKTLGIHRDKQLPQFHGETFADWFRKDAPQGSGENGAVVLFNSCFVNYNGPDIGRDVVEVLARNHLRIQLGGVACCGMPALDAADIDFAKAQARKNVEALYPLVEQGLPIAVVNPTCSLMLRREYPELLAIPGEDELTRKAVAVAESTYDIAEFVFLKLHREKKLDVGFRSTPGPIAYQVPCHLKMQNIGFRSRDLMRRIPEVKVKLVSECTGHDGTFAMKVEHYDESIKAGQRAFDGMRKADAEIWATDCPMAAIQLEQHAGKKAYHPFQILARAYREDGFPTKIEATE
ncbi:hypothetical protein HOI71_22070 [Candidatus Poribacteria bacterium]|nr:hypothetical protein [Candidatus Poribacteria bacterium]